MVLPSAFLNTTLLLINYDALGGDRVLCMWQQHCKNQENLSFFEVKMMSKDVYMFYR